jgi:polygalacturonase
LEKRPPKQSAPDVIYFGPGVHEAGRIVVTNNQTLYLAGGAVVKGGIDAQGENIRIQGRGILDGSDYDWTKGPTPFVVAIRGTNVEVSGITIRGAWHWTIVPRNSRNVIVRNVKLCGARVQNDDGINPCNSQDVLITDCFIRTDDDCVALKGLDLNGPSNVEHIRVENCTLWCDRARIFLLGHESRAPFMRDIRLRDLDIVHFSMTAFLFEPGEEMQLQDVKVENVRVNGEGQGELIRLRPVVNQYMRNKVPGYIRNVAFRDLTVSGKPGPYRVQVSGADQKHDIQGVSFQNVQILGSNLSETSECLELGKYVGDLQLR